MSQEATNFNIDETEALKSQLVQEIQGVEELKNIEDVNIFNIMIVLEELKKQFLQRREFVQRRVNELDYQIQQLQCNLAFCLDVLEMVKTKQSTDKLVNERKKLLLEKQLMKKLDINNQFTYNMIGMGIQTFKNLTQGLDWDEMKL